MNIVLLGAPGAGKGTQAGFIKNLYPVVHISTGDIFRENLRYGTPLGRLAKSYMDEGKLVPDSVTCDLVRDRIGQDDVRENGYMLDGFPRNLYQAGQLDTFSEVDACIDIDVPADLLMDRICGRRVCRCGASYHISDLHGDMRCRKCGGELYQREDDNPETVSKRIGTYFSETAPLEDYYAAQGKLIKIDGTRTPEEVFGSVRTALDSLR